MVSRADLLRALAVSPDVSQVRIADLLGFADVGFVGQGAVAGAKDAEATAELAPVATPPNPNDPERPDSTPWPPAEGAIATYYRLTRMTFTDAESRRQGTAASQAEGLSVADVLTTASPGAWSPLVRPLEAWARLWPRLRDMLQRLYESRDPDMPRLAECLARCELPGRIPRARQRRWPERAHLWLDFDVRLQPFREDMWLVVRNLRRACGKAGLHVQCVESPRAAIEDYVSGLAAGETLIVLGDLGLLGTGLDRQSWRSLARRLAVREVEVRCLCPIGPLALQEVASGMAAIEPWSRRAMPRPGPARAPESAGLAEDTPAARLLGLCSLAQVVDPPLLRALRLLVPGAGPEDEARVWSACGTSTLGPFGLCPTSETRVVAQARLRSESLELRTAARRAVRATHAGWPPEIRHLESLAWRLTGGGGFDEVEVEAWRRAQTYFTRLATDLERGRSPSTLEPRALRGFASSALAQLPRAAFEDPHVGDALQRAFIFAHRELPDRSSVRLPEGISASRFWDLLDTHAPDAWWAMRQIGGDLVFTPRDSSAWPSDIECPGSPMAWLLARGGTAVLTEADGTRRLLMLSEGLRIPLDPARPLTLETSASTITIEPVSRRTEPWATAGMGRDRYGLWADAEFESTGIVQRFRWIPPGRFWMGSPETEAGRRANEGPRHLVTFTSGYWMADSPVTQALWHAVVGDNPSRYTNDDRPVRRVSWNAVSTFIGALNARSPEWLLRRPCEAEWEGACRAGRDGRTWASAPAKLESAVHRRLRDASPERGPSDFDTDVEARQAVAEWSEAPETPLEPGRDAVKQTPPNPFGLYDLFGLVSEWCEDTPDEYQEQPISDPTAVFNSARQEFRVVRGGVKFDEVSLIGPASRALLRVSDNSERLGVRLARGKESLASNEGSVLAHGQSPRKAD